MKLEIAIHEQVKKVNLERSVSKDFREAYSGTTATKVSEIIVRKRDFGSIIVSVDDKVLELRQVRRTPNFVEFSINGETVSANVSGRFGVAKTYSEAASVNELVTANFPAKVVKISSTPGLHLKQNDTIMVIEAMKMEAQIKTPANCFVVQIFVSEGDLVEKGSKLARLRFERILRNVSYP